MTRKLWSYGTEAVADKRMCLFSSVEKRQSMLFSATQTRKVEDLARLSLKKEPLYVGVHDHLESSTPDNLEQGYVVCPSERRFLLLFTFLKKNKGKKIIVSVGVKLQCPGGSAYVSFDCVSSGILSACL